MNIIAALERTVPFSLFNRGFAGKIFTDVKKSGTKVVMKNNAPECVLVSPQEYIDMMNLVNDARLLLLATQRMENYDPNTTISGEEMQKRLGITDEELQEMDEVEFE